jgi:6-phosphogluconolactonase
MKAPELVVGTREELTAAFARLFERAAADAIAAHGRFACAVPGGSVATTFFPSLVDAAVDWPRVEVFWADERAVPATDEASNFRLAQQLWLAHVPIDRSKVHRIEGEARDLDRAALSYTVELTATLGLSPQLDLVLLGVGADGHVASLFPGHPALTGGVGFVVAVRDAPKPPPERLTLTMTSLLAARAICIAGFEPEKADVLRAAMASPDAGSTAPVARLIAIHPDVTVMLSGAAGLQTGRLQVRPV